MITLKDFMEIVGYRITEGSQYCWECFGNKAFTLDSWNGDHDGASMSIIFDTDSQIVYQVSVYDYRNQRAYRKINPEYEAKYIAERKTRGVDDDAWDCVPYTDLEVDEDFIEKSTAIINGDDYDTDVSIPLNLDDATAMILFKSAHEENMTFNDYVNKILREEFNRLSNMSKKELKRYKRRFDEEQGRI